jgi:hypothetical protein
MMGTRDAGRFSPLRAALLALALLQVNPLVNTRTALILEAAVSEAPADGLARAATHPAPPKGGCAPAKAPPQSAPASPPHTHTKQNQVAGASSYSTFDYGSVYGRIDCAADSAATPVSTRELADAVKAHAAAAKAAGAALKIRATHS